MDASTNFSLTQLILVWTLLGFLLTWMVIFAVLAIHSHSHEILAQEDVLTASTPLLEISRLPKLRSVPSLPRHAAAETVNAEPLMPGKAMASS